MPQSRAQTLRSSVAGQRPSGQEPGTLYVNFADRQAGYLDPAKAAKDLIPIRYFETTATYAAGDMVVKDGDIYVADIPITPGAFNPANWTTLFNVDDLSPLLDAKVDVAGDTMTGMLTLPVTTPTVANHATRKGYVDAQDTALQNAINLKLSDAPVDGLTYGRKDAAWSTVIGGASMLDGPPAGPLQNGQLWYETDTGNTYVYYNDGNSSQWVQQSGSLAVPLPPSIDGALISDGPPASPQAGQMWWESDSGRLFVFYNDGTTSQWVQISGPLRAPVFLQKQMITVAGLITLHADTKYFLVEGVGGGGGSGGCTTGGTQAGGAGGGGGGGYFSRWITRTAGISPNVGAIGAAGAAGAAAGAGGAAGQTTYNDGTNTMQANGGGGGAYGLGNVYGYAIMGGSGGGAAGGQINLQGEHGGYGGGDGRTAGSLSGFGGHGGSSPFGRGGYAGAYNGPAGGTSWIAPWGYGAGGGGAGCAGGGVIAGSAGTAGCVVVTEFG